MNRFAIPLAGGLVLAMGGPAFAIDTPNERVTLAGLGAVHVVVDELLREAPARYVYSVDLTLRQHTRLIRDRAIESYAITWSENRQAGVVDAATSAPCGTPCEPKCSSSSPPGRPSTRCASPPAGADIDRRARKKRR